MTAADRPWLRALTSQLRNRRNRWPRDRDHRDRGALTSRIGASSARCATGCRVALDDFGAGHTSLRHLQTLAVDTVKIDGSFVHNLSASPDNQIFLRHLVGLANGFGFHTVAEGVETAAEAAILHREGIGYMQGYYYGRPSLDRPWLDAPAANLIPSRRAAASA